MTASADARFDLTIARTFDAPVHLVFEIWTTREHMIRWWGPRDHETTHLDLDFRVGGAYRACILNLANVESWMGGRFVEIVENERIVFTFQWEGAADSIGVETLITVTFEERDGKTTQTLHQAPFLDADSRDNHIRGWTQLIEREQAYAERASRGGA